MRKIGKYFFH